MRAGKLDRRITIQRASTVKDGFNEDVETFEDVATVWGQQRPQRGSERFTAAEMAGSAVTTFHIRYRADVTVMDRLVYGGKTWDIKDVREIGRRVVTEIDAIARSE